VFALSKSSIITIPALRGDMENSNKVVLLGAGSVGKTSIAVRWKYNRFSAVTDRTIRAGSFSREVKGRSGRVVINLWDTAGQEEFHAIAPIYYKDAVAALLVFSVDDPTSCEAAANWYPELAKNVGGRIAIVVVANKIDIAHRRVPEESGIKFANSINADYFEVSACTGEGIEAMFKAVARIIEDRPATVPKLSTPKRRGLQVTDAVEEEVLPEESGGCC
jgi:small GTP-binding protein